MGIVNFLHRSPAPLSLCIICQRYLDSLLEEVSRLLNAYASAILASES